MDYVVHGILQARILEWIAVPISRGSSQPRDRTQVSHIAGGFFTSWDTREAQFRTGPDQMTGILIRSGKVGPRYRHRRTSRDHGSRNPNQGIPIVLAEVYVIYYNVIINIQIYEIHRSVDDVRLYVIIVPRVIHTMRPSLANLDGKNIQKRMHRSEGMAHLPTKQNSCWGNINIAHPVLVSGESDLKVCSNGNAHPVPLALFRIWIVLSLLFFLFLNFFCVITSWHWLRAYC